MYHLCNTQNANFSWLNSVRTILDECVFLYIWETQIFINEVWLKFNIKMRLHDQFQQIWREIFDCFPVLTFSLISFNPDKTEIMLFSNTDFRYNFNFTFNGNTIPITMSHKHLGVTLSSDVIHKMQIFLG
jgi:hypothetical protein